MAQNRKPPQYDPRIKYAVQLREPPPLTREQLNQRFVEDLRISLVTEARVELDELGSKGDVITICHGLGYCEYELDLHDEADPHRCRWCEEIYPNDPRSSEQILKQMVQRRTRGRN